MLWSKGFLQNFFTNNKDELAKLFRDNIKLNVRMSSNKEDSKTKVGVAISLVMFDNTDKRIVLAECSDHIYI